MKSFSLNLCPLKTRNVRPRGDGGDGRRSSKRQTVLEKKKSNRIAKQNKYSHAIRKRDDTGYKEKEKAVGCQRERANAQNRNCDALKHISTGEAENWFLSQPTERCTYSAGTVRFVCLAPIRWSIFAHGFGSVFVA